MQILIPKGQGQCLSDDNVVLRSLVTEQAHYAFQPMRLDELRPSAPFYLASVWSYKQKMHVTLHDLK